MKKIKDMTHRELREELLFHMGAMRAIRRTHDKIINAFFDGEINEAREATREQKDVLDSYTRGTKVTV